MDYDVIVIGGGHAGCEAAYFSALLGAKTCLITLKVETLGEMSCNPAMGGIGKGHLIYEIESLNGIIGKISDKSAIHYRLLNRRKGPAVRGLRAQIDRRLYKSYMQQTLLAQKNLTIIEDVVNDIQIKKNNDFNIITSKYIIESKSVIITTGTFLNGMIHIGKNKHSAGRVGEKASIQLSDLFLKKNFKTGRLKTGTPARICAKSINWEKIDLQFSDEVPIYFSNSNKQNNDFIICGITHTNLKTNKIIRNNIHLSAMYSGEIQGVGPRYCPSIEDKVIRFVTKDSHQVFLEPEGIKSNIIYPNGISTSLPEEIQEQYIKSIKGLENCKILQYGYAIEYDFINPTQLSKKLESKIIKNLYFAGQINGTTGYEEASAQGLITGINAALSIKEQDFLDLSRYNSYIGLLVDDLAYKGVTEPYRMFTSRSENRLMLRQDNAILRFIEIIKKNEFYNKYQMDNIIKYINNIDILLKNINFCNKISACNEIEDILEELNLNFDYCYKEFLTAYAQKLYEPYTKRQELEIKKLQKINSMNIDLDETILNIPGLSNEVINKLKKILPCHFEYLQRSEGITPTALLLIYSYVSKREK